MYLFVELISMNVGIANLIFLEEIQDFLASGEVNAKVHLLLMIAFFPSRPFVCSFNFLYFKYFCIFFLCVASFFTKATTTKFSPETTLLLFFCHCLRHFLWRFFLHFFTSLCIGKTCCLLPTNSWSVIPLKKCFHFESWDRLLLQIACNVVHKHS